MTTVIELLRQGRKDEVWEKCCGFVDLSLQEFMRVQERLLLEQIILMSQCELGRKIMRGHVSKDSNDFRRSVRLTTYKDYIPLLLNKREDVLPRPVYRWACTSGRSAEFDSKWVPYTKEAFDKMGLCFLGGLIFKLSEKRGQVPLREEDVMLQVLAPPPYVTGAIAIPSILEQFPMRIIPELDDADQKGFQARLEEGFRLALREGIDILFAIPSVLVRVGEQFEQQARTMSISSLLHPKIIFRSLKGWLRAKIARRPMLPKDLWSVKAIATAGTGTAIFRERIKKYWGQAPGEGYACTEGGVMAMQPWGGGLTFIPDSNFFEFIPEKEHLIWKEDPTYVPTTVLLDELEVGGIYELVITNFHGGPFLRYRLGDLVRVISLGDPQHGIDIPQIMFHARADDIIDLAGFPRLTEKAIGMAIENANISCVDWVARKEVVDERPVAHIYIELRRSELRGAEKICEDIHQALENLDPNYQDLESMLGWKPVKVTKLSPGTFERYMLERQAAGADLAHFKPPHMQPTDKIMADLLRLSRQV